MWSDERVGTPASRSPSPEFDAALAAAKRLRADLGFGDDCPIDDVVQLAERRLGIEVVIVPLPRGVDGLYVPLEPEPIVIVAADQPPARQRFTLAHELGHHELGHGAAPRVLGSAGEAAVGRDSREQPPAPAAASGPTPQAGDYAIRRHHQPQEREANAFAGELLTPDAGAVLVAADSAGEPMLDRVVRLSAHYGISALSALVKLQLIGIVDRVEFEFVRAQLKDGSHLPRYAALGLPALDDTLERLAVNGERVRCSPQARGALRHLRAELDAEHE